MKKDIIIIVIASRGKTYDNFINHYWKNIIEYVNNNHNNIKIYLIFGNDLNMDGILVDKDDIIISNSKESWIPGILEKTIFSLEYIDKNYDYKHIFRTNLSSFLIINNLIKMSDKLDNKELYGGVVGLHENTNYVSGAGIWLSKDYVRYIINNKNKINYNEIDDVAIGLLMKNKKITDGINRYDIKEGEIIDKKSFSKIIKDHYHIRVKIDRQENKSSNDDIEYMKKMTNYIYSEKEKNNNSIIILLFILLLIILLIKNKDYLIKTFKNLIYQL